MRSNLFGYCTAVAAVFLNTMTASMAAGGAFTRGCAARDGQIMMMLEFGNISTQRMDHAMHTIMHARILCFEGQVVDALALYDDIAQSITSSDYVLSGRP
jgi:hypothetical protein